VNLKITADHQVGSSRPGGRAPADGVSATHGGRRTACGRRVTDRLEQPAAL